ncbi:MAG TPA: choice-of-anchor tandem repeat GloVer-containing protein [Terriglobales bacterium]|nr:choice-of-anchor tandem repeat GloVer-containing protein [Terriglobales bacterium]
MNALTQTPHARLRPLWLGGMVALSLLVVVGAAHAQTFAVIHSFNGPDGYVPMAGLTVDAGGNLYGTTRSGGSFNLPPFCQVYAEIGCGTVFKLWKHNSSWLLATLFSFAGRDGAYPTTPLTIGPGGVVFGTTSVGGTCSSSPYGCGTVFRLIPPPQTPASLIFSWQESVLHVFTGNNDGGPRPGALIFDNSGNMYGTSFFGGPTGNGLVFEFTPSGNDWTENVLYTFEGGTDGSGPRDPVADSSFDHLFGVTGGGGNSGCDRLGCGTIYELTRSGSGWTKTILHVFTDGADGAWPSGTPILDSAGNLYGTAPGAFSSGGAVWELSPSAGGWTFSVLYTFNGCSNCGPYGGVTMDAAGNLYGTTFGDGAFGKGNVFRLSPSNGGWTYSDLHDFTGGSDGASPQGGVSLDSHNNVYGTAPQGGIDGVNGVAWEITP